MTDHTTPDEPLVDDSASSSSTAGPTPWSLGGDAPEPQIIKAPEPVDVKKIATADTHTGTDPLGRAVGPAEDHLRVKKVFDEDGKVRNPYTLTTGDDGKPKREAIDTRAPEARAKKAAEATGTKPEAVDDPKPYTPSEVAAAHAAGEVLAPKEK